MPPTTNPHSETGHLSEERETPVSPTSSNTPEDGVQQDEQLRPPTDNSNPTAGPSNQQQPAGVTLDPGALERIFQANNENIERLLNAVSAQRSGPGEKQKFPEPGHYEGKSKKEYREWTRAVTEYLDAKAHAYPTEKDKVRFAVAWIKGTPKTAWELRKASVDLETFTWSNLKGFLLDQLEDPKDRGVNAALRFEGLKQSDNQRIQNFEGVYLDHLEEMVMGDPTRADADLWGQMYYAKLKPSAQKAIMGVGPVPKKIQDITTVGQRMEKIESTWRDRKDDKTTSRQFGGQKSSDRQRTSDDRHSSKTDTSSSATGDKRKAGGQPSSRSRKRIPIEESQDREKQRREGRCFNCNDTGHMASKCPKKEEKSSN